MGKIKDLTGQKFGRLTVIKFYGFDKWNQALWECNCDCGFEGAIATGGNLRTGRIKSCGCLRTEKSIERCRQGLKNIKKELLQKKPNKNIQLDYKWLGVICKWEIMMP